MAFITFHSFIFNVHAVGIDLLQKVILMRETNSNIHHSYGTKRLSLLQPTDVCIIDPEYDDAPQVQVHRPEKPLKSKNEDTSMYASNCQQYHTHLYLKILITRDAQ